MTVVSSNIPTNLVSLHLNIYDFQTFLVPGTETHRDIFEIPSPDLHHKKEKQCFAQFCNLQLNAKNTMFQCTVHYYIALDAML
jgi:hypothetical protein